MLGRTTSSLRKLVVALALTAVLGGPLVTASAQVAGVDAPASPPVQTGRILGVHPTITSAGMGPYSSHAAAPLKLLYHGGLVEHSSKVYAIYWVPPGYTVSTNYKTLINQFFTDVAANSGKTTTVYYSDTQYTDRTGYVYYKDTFGGSVTDTNPLPASGCSDSPYASVCVTDAQIQTEVQRVIAAQHWTANSTTEFFMFTAKGIGGCFDGSSSACTFSMYCAYHSWMGGGASATLYANMPYAATANCDSGQRPNHDDADVTINVTSHEHNETITDEQGSAWWDAYGNENGDKCAWSFGASSGTNGSKYNQTINNHHYWLQQEWSNASGKCVLQGH